MNIVKIEEQQVQRAVDILITAFADDPLFVHVFKTSGKYKKVGGRLFTAWVRWSMKYGIACMTADENAVMLLRKIGETDMSIPEMMKTGMLLSPFELGIGAFRRFYLQVGGELQKKHSEIMGNTPHLYAWMLASEHKGNGMGSLMLKHCIDIAGQDKLPVYFETSIPGNVQFYRKRGFELKDELICKSGAVPFYFMLKPYVII